MAHSSATVATGGVNYFYKDENGKILKVIKPADNIKRETLNRSGGDGILYAATTNNKPNSNNGNRSGSDGSGGKMGPFSEIHQEHFVRIPNNYIIPKTEDNSYTIVTPHNSDDMHDTTLINTIKGGGGGGKYNTPNHNNIRNTKSKLHSIQGSSNTPTTTTHNTSSPLSSSVQKKRKPDKAGKGLRHFSMKVCEKVKEKGNTSYNEVAEELVNEELKNNFNDSNCDDKNIRRRVYDALNVLMAMQIISKDKKEIRWKGLPTNSIEQSTALEKENAERRERIKQKHEQLRELIKQQVAFKSLIERNKQAESQGIVPTPNSSIQLPFIIVNTCKTTKINCSVTNDKSEYVFKFDNQFEMHDDIEVLRRMGLLHGLDKGECTPEEIEHAKSLVPPNFAKYIEAYGRCSDEDELTNSYIQSQNYANNLHNTTAAEDVKPNFYDDDEEDIDSD